MKFKLFNPGKKKFGKRVPGKITWDNPNPNPPRVKKRYKDIKYSG